MLRMMPSLSIIRDIFGRYSQTCTPVTFVWIGRNGPAGRATGLHVEGVDLAGAAVHPEEDAAFAAPGRLLGDGLRARQRAPVVEGEAARGDEGALHERNDDSRDSGTWRRSVFPVGWVS